MDKDETLEKLLTLDAPAERVEELMNLIDIDLPSVTDDVKRFLLKQQVEMFELEYARYALKTPVSESMVDALMEDAIDTHAHGASDPFERLQFEDEIGIDCTRNRMKAVVIKTWYTPSASRTALVQRYVDRWAEEHGMRPTLLYGGVTLNASVGGLNPEAVRKCLGFPRFKYVWMPMADSYYHQLIVFNRKNAGIHFLDESGKLVPAAEEILRIIADNDLVLACGHYPYRDAIVLMEAAKRLGVRRMEIVHPTLIHSKHTLPQMKEMAREGVKIGLMGIASVNVRFLEGIRWYFRTIRELSDHMILGSDAGQIQNPRHVDGLRWLVKVLLAYGITPAEITRIYKTNPAAHIGLA